MSTGSIGGAILTGGVGQAAGSLVGPAADAGRGIYSYLKCKYDLIKNLDENFLNLDSEAGYLSSKDKDVKDLIATNSVVMERTHECNTWLENVSIIMTNLEDLKTRYRKTSSGSYGPCQLRTRLKLSKEIVKMTKSVVDLKDRISLEQIILRERPPERVENKFPKKISEVPSLRENVEKLLELLKDDSIKKIGVWGMSGVGKTTILEHLNNELEKLQIFDIVLWVTVSKEGNLRQIQQEILKRLRVKVEATDAENQATYLISRSLENKRYLLLLDEVSSEINLRHVGIHDGHMQGKVVVATREKMICNYMETDEEIKVERLSRNDARKLFYDQVGKAVEHPVIKPIAERVLKQCGELPQVIRAVGIHLKDKFNEDYWRNTLSKLQSPSMDQLKHMEDVFTAFKLIYEELHDSLRDCLLYGASFPEDYEIYPDYLIECWKAEQLIGIGQTLRKACEEGHTNLVILIDRCLFDRCKSMKYVKMPIIFRNAALKMAYQQNFGLLVIDEEELESHPPEEKWRNARVISLMNSSLKELPERPECPRISSLFLQKNEPLSTIPETFFESMMTLKLLDLYGTSIKFLPSSLSKLTDLRGLFLNDCRQLVHLPEEIRELQNLEVLDICRTGIHSLPAVIGELTSLRCLRVSFTSASSNQNHVESNGMEECPCKIFERLLQLEELTVDANPQDARWKKIAPDVAEQLAKLGKLSTLTFYFPNEQSLEVFTKTSISRKNGTSSIVSNFRSFNIYVGPHRTSSSPRFDVSKCLGRRYLQYSGGNDAPYVIKEVLGRACAFKLTGHQNIKNFSDFGIDKMESLEACEVEECNTMTAVIDGNMAGTHAFPWLRELHLLKLQQLKLICNGPISQDSFARLTTLTLNDCPNVVKVVSREIANQLTELQHLRVENCSQVTEIIETDAHSGVCPKLKSLELVGLKELVSIHSNDSFEWKALQYLEIIECEELVNLCLTAVNATKLRSIRCREAWWRALMLSDEIRSHLLRFCCFIEEN